MITLQSPVLVERVENFARTTNQDKTQVVETAVQNYLDQVEREKIHAETEAFWQMYTNLQTHYLNEFVAIHEGKVVDHDKDVLQLEQRVIEQLGDIAFLIAPVTTSVRRELRTVSFHMESTA